MSEWTSHFYCDIHKTVPEHFVGARGLNVVPVEADVRCDVCHRRAVQCESRFPTDDDLVRDRELPAIEILTLKHRVESQLYRFWRTLIAR